ncbi:MAG: FkbM family methyltransferase [Chlamydiales bacterium]|nr:FkbM family methyltransferase [Chlamydiales bacterium]
MFLRVKSYLKSRVSVEKWIELSHFKNSLKVSFSRLCFGFGTKSYAQFGEDMILKSIFDGQKKGFYVDVGAHHPKNLSNTFYFYKRGWKGINIDAMPGSMKKFLHKRKRDINLEVAISDKEQFLDFYTFNKSAINSFSREHVEELENVENVVVSKQKISTTTLAKVLDQYFPKQQCIDFLSIDVEGLDLSVLQSNNWSKYRPKAIVVEDLKVSLNDLQSSSVYQYLRSKGYVLCSLSGPSLIFIREDVNWYNNREV